MKLRGLCCVLTETSFFLILVEVWRLKVPFLSRSSLDLFPNSNLEDLAVEESSWVWVRWLLLALLSMALAWIEVAECDLLFGSSNGLELIEPDFVVNRLSRACGCCPTARRWRSGGVFDCSPSPFRAAWAAPKVLPVLLLVLGVCHGGGKKDVFSLFKIFQYYICTYSQVRSTIKRLVLNYNLTFTDCFWR